MRDCPGVLAAGAAGVGLPTGSGAAVAASSAFGGEDIVRGWSEDARRDQYLAELALRG